MIFQIYYDDNKFFDIAMLNLLLGHQECKFLETAVFFLQGRKS